MTKITSLDDESRRRILTKVQKAELSLARIDALAWYYYMLICWSSLAPLIAISLIGTPAALGIIYHPNYENTEWLTVITLTALFTLMLTLFVISPLLLFGASTDFRLKLTFAWIVAANAFFVYSAARILQGLLVSSIQPLEFSVVAGLIATCVFTGGIAFIIGLVVQLLSYVKARVFKRYPTQMATDRILKSLHIAELGPSKWNADLKRVFMYQLESLADIMESHFPRQLKTYDSQTDYWFKETSSKRASAVRELKKCILTPKPETRDFLVDKLSHYLSLAVDGYWDGFELSSQPPYPLLQQSTTRLLNVLPSLVFAFFPLLLILGVQNTQIAIHGGLEGVLVFIAVIWCIVSLLSIFDPSYSERLAAVRQIMDMLTGKSSTNVPP